MGEQFGALKWKAENLTCGENLLGPGSGLGVLHMLLGVHSLSSSILEAW